MSKHLFCSFWVICFLFALTSCKTPDNSRVADAPLAADPSSLCRWSRAKTYEEFKQLALYNYDAPASIYEPANYSASSLNSDKVLEDLSCLRLVLANLYSGTDVFKQQGVDLVARLDQVVEQYDGNPMSTYLLAMYIRALWTGVFDGHFSLKFYSYNDDVAAHQPKGFGAGLSYPIFVYTTESLAAKKIKKCGDLHLSKAYGNLSGDVFTGYLPGDTSPVPLTITCTNDTGQSTNVAIMAIAESDAIKHTADDHAKGAILTATPDGIDILKITSFPEPATNEQRQIAKNLAESDRPLIIDVRGDRGGAPEFNDLLRDALFSRDQNDEYSKSRTKNGWLRVFAVTQTFKNMDQENLLYPNMTPAQRLASHDHYEQMIKNWETSELHKLNAYNIQSVHQTFQGTGVTVTSGKRQTPRKSPVVVLTDRGCGSQCDFLVSALRHLPVAKGHILGIPTAGRMNFGNNAYVFLPNSRLSLTTSIASNVHEPAVIEGQGVQPDLFVLSGDVQAQGLAYMRQLLKRQPAQ